MKKPFIRLLFFLILMLALAAGLTYLSLNHVSETQSEENSKKMDVALVNEDEGATFNDEHLDFGNAFVKSLDKSDQQEWYVVSRGVAENGFDRGTYDMMIVIPNDFSQKALSMNEDMPEQVVLDYKINATENENVQSQAEETASSILNDFNRRIIDVYFTSVIGNLQDAQDNIMELVNEGAEHTNTFNNDIHHPLSNYTDRFDDVKTNTVASKDTFGGLEDELKSFGESASERVDSSEDYQSSISDTVGLNESANELRVDFMSQLNNYNDDLTDSDVNEQLKKLQQANEYINEQFSEEEEEAADDQQVIALKTEELKNRLDKTLGTVQEAHDNLDEALQEGIVDEEIEAKLGGIIHNAFDEKDDLSKLFEEQNERAIDQIDDRISQLPSLNQDAIYDSDLHQETIQEITNVIKVTEKYDDEDFGDVEIDEREILPDHIKNLKEHLQNEGITMTDPVILPANEKPEQTFKLHDVSEEFAIEYLSLDLPGQETEIYEGEAAREPISLPSNQKGEFTVELKLTLQEDENGDLSDYDVYNQSSEWSWSLHQCDIGDEKGDSAYNCEEKLSGFHEDSQAKTEDFEADEESEDEDGEDEGNSDDGNNEYNDEDNDDEDEREIIEVDVIDNHIHHQVTEPVIDEPSETLIHVVEDTVAPYQKLLTLYESYFGFDLTSEEIFSNGDEDVDLREAATEDSLYYLFNKTSVKEKLAEYIIEQIKDDVKEEINNPLNDFQERIASHQDDVNDIYNNAKTLAAKVVETREEARRLNNNLEETLNNISDWRDNSTNLLDSRTEIQEVSDEEHTAVMSLGDEFQPLLSESQSLADQAASNLETVDNVYLTFDRVDEQADEIDQSGSKLVDQANHLSVEMTDKLSEDEKFADNFSNVLANSRMGDKQNEDLYDFLSSPVDTKNKGLIVKGDTFTPYFLVLIAFIVALFTAYVISTMNEQRTKDQFDEEQSLIESNALITGITVGIGIVEGLVIGLLSAYYLNMSEGTLIIWTGLMILVLLSMLLVSTYLLRQLKTTGMFILLAIMSTYLFFTEALGSNFSGGSQMRLYSPLHYVEDVLTKAVQGMTSYPFIVISIIVVMLATVANLLVLSGSRGSVEKDDEDVLESQG